MVTRPRKVFPSHRQVKTLAKIELIENRVQSQKDLWNSKKLELYLLDHNRKVSEPRNGVNLGAAAAAVNQRDSGTLNYAHDELQRQGNAMSRRSSNQAEEDKNSLDSSNDSDIILNENIEEPKPQIDQEGMQQVFPGWFVRGSLRQQNDGEAQPDQIEPAADQNNVGELQAGQDV